MRYIISGKNIDITPGLKEAAENKIGKLERYFSPDTEVQVTMSVEKGRQKIEVTIPVKGSIIPVFRRSTRKVPSFSSRHFFISFPASRFFLYLQQIFNALLGLFLLKKFF